MEHPETPEDMPIRHHPEEGALSSLFWAECVQRGDKLYLVIHRDAEPRGSVELHSQEELESWAIGLAKVNESLKS